MTGVHIVGHWSIPEKSDISLDTGQFRRCLIYRWTLATAGDVYDVSLDTRHCRRCVWYIVGHWPLSEMCLIYRWTMVTAGDVYDISLDTGHCRRCVWYIVGQWPLPEMCLIYRWTLANAGDVFDIPLATAGDVFDIQDVSEDFCASFFGWNWYYKCIFLRTLDRANHFPQMDQLGLVDVTEYDLKINFTWRRKQDVHPITRHEAQREATGISNVGLPQTMDYVPCDILVMNQQLSQTIEGSLVSWLISIWLQSETPHLRAMVKKKLTRRHTGKWRYNSTNSKSQY
jgi:hypothetical protein